jgi:hypothetical protein
MQVARDLLGTPSALPRRHFSTGSYELTNLLRQVKVRALFVAGKDPDSNDPIGGHGFLLLFLRSDDEDSPPSGRHPNLQSLLLKKPISAGGSSGV